MKVALTTMEAALLKAHGFSMPESEKIGNDFRVFAIKGQDRAEVLGRTPEQAASKLVRLIVMR